MSYVSVGLLGSREQGNLRKCSPSALESALRNRGALRSAPESALEGALEGALLVVLYRERTLESTLESAWGALSEISLFSAPKQANRHVSHVVSLRKCP